MIKILFLIHDLSVGGAEKVLVNLVNNMNYARYEITVMSLFDEGVNRQFLNKEIVYKYCFKNVIKGNSHLMKLLSPKFLYNWLIKDEYDIVVSFLEGPCARIISGCPIGTTKVVSWIHCTMHSKKELSASFRNYVEAKKCYERSDAIVFVSKEVKEAFLKVCDVSCETEVLYNTNESTKIRNFGKIENALDFEKNNAFKWCGVGKIVPNKGFDRMIRIQNRLLQAGYSAHFYALGTGPQLQELQKWCVSNGISGNVSFLGYQTNPYQYVSKCDLFVCASYTEGFSTAATEALLLGVPVLTTEVSGMREMLGENNEYGIIVKNDEEALYKKIKELLDNKELLNYYKKQAYKRGEDFCTERTIEATQRFFERLVG